MGKTKAAMVLVRAKGTLSRDPLRDPRIVELGFRFQELQREGFRNAVDTIVELGQILMEAKPLLARRYGKWLEHIGVSAKTAHNYESLALMAAKQPIIIERWKELGPSKLYRIGDMSMEGRRALLKPRAAESLRAMTDRDFTEVTQKYLVRRTKVTADMRAHGLRMKLAAWITALEGARVVGVKNPELRAGLAADLEGLRRAAAAVARRCLG